MLRVQGQLKYNNRLIARVWTFHDLGYCFIKILFQQVFQFLGAFAPAGVDALVLYLFVSKE
ncbi:hypothetical protein GXM_07909 [Nostoc sphaeroides CCNUC1]|uniref:Uncharacterized protein n=1 Tax=Nostoc sphaeroides CCNUC1 TaxID=2653204 RepID=A0A5P8WC69_9NOSO|nr:hypothetical protein GXM_07909 [Nostoc sphaeroides CCNUC1]